MSRGVRLRRRYRTARRLIDDIKVELFLALVAGDELTAASAHAELIDLQHEVRIIEDVVRITAKVAP